MKRDTSDLFAILANREHRLPTLIASQSGPHNWAQALPDRVAADSIVNLLANNARTINLGQIDMRRHRDQQARATDGNSKQPHHVDRERNPNTGRYPVTGTPPPTTRTSATNKS